MEVTHCQCVFELEPLEAKSKLAGATFHEPLGIEVAMTAFVRHERGKIGCNTQGVMWKEVEPESG